MKKNKIVSQTAPFVIAEYLFLRKALKRFVNATDAMMQGDSHRSGGFTCLKVSGVHFDKKSLIDINETYKERFGGDSHLQIETMNGMVIFSKVV